ncbi:hypothetical protein HPB47_017458 [Ixodes persulcatus]|uniref:Uncharacterized protein n=1 Tax=Ixodes persulcatus TaxID=34615 RepID=A0AC60QN83_IXOPE|nr:hypothetical protein HPB47_017458 [Ixodes persulcatus]
MAVPRFREALGTRCETLAPTYTSRRRRGTGQAVAQAHLLLPLRCWRSGTSIVRLLGQPTPERALGGPRKKIFKGPKMSTGRGPAEPTAALVHSIQASIGGQAPEVTTSNGMTSLPSTQKLSALIGHPLA